MGFFSMLKNIEFKPTYCGIQFLFLHMQSAPCLCVIFLLEPKPEKPNRKISALKWALSHHQRHCSLSPTTELMKGSAPLALAFLVDTQVCRRAQQCSGVSRVHRTEEQRRVCLPAIIPAHVVFLRDAARQKHKGEGRHFTRRRCWCTEAWWAAAELFVVFNIREVRALRNKGLGADGE